MRLTEDVIIECNNKLREIFTALKRRDKVALLETIRDKSAPEVFDSFNCCDVLLAWEFITESPERRLKLKKFSPPRLKVPFPVFIFFCYYIFEDVFYVMLYLFHYTAEVKDPLSYAMQYSHAYLFDHLFLSHPQSLRVSNPSKLPLGTFFFEWYPYQEAVNALTVL